MWGSVVHLVFNAFSGRLQLDSCDRLVDITCGRRVRKATSFHLPNEHWYQTLSGPWYLERSIKGKPKTVSSLYSLSSILCLLDSYMPLLSLHSSIINGPTVHLCYTHIYLVCRVNLAFVRIQSELVAVPVAEPQFNVCKFPCLRCLMYSP